MVLVQNGWKLFYHPVFGDRYAELRDRVRVLKKQLRSDEFVRHPDVKLVAAVRRVVLEIIPENPNRPDFWLKDELAKFRRVKHYGLPDRYRLFYVFSEQQKVVIVLYLNESGTLRKQGAKTDPYEVFGELLRSGQIGADFEGNLALWKSARKL